VFEAQYEELIVTQQIRSSLNLSTNDEQALCQNAWSSLLLDNVFQTRWKCFDTFMQLIIYYQLLCLV